MAEVPFPEPDPEPFPPLEALRCAAPFDAVRTPIHLLKYEGVRRLADPLAARLADVVKQSGWPADVVVPVPLNITRLSERGFNQAALLASGVARRCRLVCAPDAMRRLRHTTPQVTLNAQERAINVFGAFEADPEQVKGRAVIVVDDVFTTGATMCTCAEALKQAGAAHVWGLAVARAAHHNDAPPPEPDGPSLSSKSHTQRSVLHADSNTRQEY